MHKLTMTLCCSAVLLAINFSTYASATRYLYGTTEAEQTTGKSSSTYFISLGSFNNKDNATRLYQSLNHSRHFPLKITQRNGHYLVVVGPLHSAQEVRAVARQVANQMQHKQIAPRNLVKRVARVTTPVYKQPQYVPVPHEMDRTTTSAIPSTWKANDNSRLEKPIKRTTYNSPRQSTYADETNAPTRWHSWKNSVRSALSEPASLTVSLGWDYATQGKAQNIGIDSLIGDYFSVTQKSGNSGVFGLGYFLEGQQRDWAQHRMNMYYGINAFYLAPTSVGGDITQEQLFTDLRYSYKVQHFPLYLAAKAIMHSRNEAYAVTLDAGIGPNFMNTFDYNDVSLNGQSLPDHAFSGTTSTTFSATAGIGFRVNNVFGPAPLECGYRFYYLGEGSLNKNSDQLLNTLGTGTSYANALLCTLML